MIYRVSKQSEDDINILGKQGKQSEDDTWGKLNRVGMIYYIE